MGCRVISVTSSGRVHDSSIAVPARTFLYSGSERPAWRMNQTGVYGTGSRLQARRKGEFVWGWFTRSILSYPIARQLTASATRRARSAEIAPAHAKIKSNLARYRTEISVILVGREV